ncbi:PTS 2-O-a-mannosyl-D-glycerate transporter subunit IIABC, partial [Escherichia coli]|nr:PTS 2-O-a-mannosyl-D-glycerate transporter subunit IIABC [Escherichia coli]
EVAIKESERFNGIPALSVPVAEPIRHAEALIQQALTLKRSDETRTVQQDTQPVKSVKTELKQALLSGISFAVPLIVAGGTVLAVAVLLSQIFGLQDLFNEENSWLWMYRKLGGGLLGILMVPVLAAYTAYSLAGITEGAIPMAIEDPLRVIGSFVLGSMVTGAIVGAMNIGLSTPGAGIFSLFLLHDNGAGGVMAAIGWFGAALVGAAISTAILLIWRRHAVKHGNYLTDGVMP